MTGIPIEINRPQDFVQYLARQWPAAAWRDHSTVVAVSGGADSVALLRAVHHLWSGNPGTGQLIVGHVNHGIRGQHSDQDELWVADLAHTLNLDVSIRRLGAQSNESNRGQGLESALRNARYLALREIAHQQGARYVLLGHSWDDQVETVLFRFLRGTGLAGLAGMPQRRPLADGVTLVRPLLQLDRKAIESYLQLLGQSYLSDPSNLSSQFTRNRIRNDLLPLLRRDFNPNLDTAIWRLAQLAGEAQEVIDQLTDRLVDQVVDFLPNGCVRLRLDRCDAPTGPLYRSIFRSIWNRMNWPQQDMSFEKWDQLAQLTLPPDADQDRPFQVVNLPGEIQAQRKNGTLWLTSK